MSVSKLKSNEVAWFVACNLLTKGIVRATRTIVLHHILPNTQSTASPVAAEYVI